MPSEYSKPVKNQEMEVDKEDESVLKNVKKNKPKSGSPPIQSNVKKDEFDGDDDDDDDFRPISQKSSGKAHKVLKKAKKEEFDSDDDDEFTPIAQKVQKKSTVKEVVVEKKIKVKKDEVVIAEKKKTGVKETEQNGQKRERKVYDLPGQKRDPPEERDPLRIFYQSLYEQRSDSDMATFWLMESGLLPKDEAMKVFERKQKRLKCKSSVHQ